MRIKANTRIDGLNREYWEKVSKSMNYDLYGGQKKVWKTLRAIFIIRQVIEKFIEFNKPAFRCCFVELTQVFHRVKLRDVLSIFHERRIVPKITSLIMFSYRKTRTTYNDFPSNLIRWQRK